jgi:predicted nucleotidyltransferase
MRTSAPPLLPIFRSNLQGRLLALLFADPRAERPVSDIVGRLGAPVPTVHREVDRLASAGILRTRHVGRTRLVQPNMEASFAEELSALVLKVYGPVLVLAESLQPVPGVDAAFVYGSWAERFDGVPGPSPMDLDVLVIGDPDPDDLYEARVKTQARLGIETNVVVQSAEDWEREASGFIRTVKRGHLIPVAVR